MKPNLATIQELNSLSYYVAALAEDYIDRQTGTINGGLLDSSRQIVRSAFAFTFADGIIPELGNMIDDVKVGFDV
jgi:hypothetical protein